MKKVASIFLNIVFMAAFAAPAFSHCEVPCGIYNDKMRFEMLEEHTATIEKAARQIVDLSSRTPQNMNQIVRWVMTKEAHAQKIQDIVSRYFLTQRIKPDGSEDTLKMLVGCHHVLVAAMKTKQSDSIQNVDALKKKVAALKKLYFSDEKHSH